MPYITSVERLAREEGREEGLEHGILAGKIQVLQQMLNQPPASTQELLMESLEVLGRKVDTLMQELREA